MNVKGRHSVIGTGYSTGTVSTGLPGSAGTSVLAVVRKAGDANHGAIDTEAYLCCIDNAQGVTSHSIGGDVSGFTFAVASDVFTLEQTSTNWTIRWTVTQM
jgi:hypothetical protein